MNDFGALLIGWAIGLVTGLVIRVGRERSSFNMGLAVGRRQSKSFTPEESEEAWRNLFR